MFAKNVLEDFIPSRMVLSILAFFGFTNLYLIRFSFAVISVSMVNSTKQSHMEICENGSNCSADASSQNIVEMDTLEWDDKTRARVLGAFSYGYCLTQIIGGRLAEVYGCKFVFGSAVLGPALLSFLLPIASRGHFWGAFFIQFLQGLSQGMAWPSMQALLSQWFPVFEKSRYMGIVCFAATLSMVYVMPLSGFLCDTVGWDIAIYIIGVIPVIWSIFWFSLVYSKPSQHPRITEDEKRYIEEAVAKSGTSQLVKKTVPWKAILTSLPFLSIIVCDVGNCYCLAIFTSQLSNYLATVYKFNLSKTGFLAGVPFLSRYAGSVFFSTIADYLVKKNQLSVTAVRRIFSVIAMFAPAIAIIVMITQMTDSTTFIWLVCTYMFFNGSITSSQLINFSDIAPNYAGTLLGISNTFGSLFAAFSIWISGEILGNNATWEDWRVLFATLVPILVSCESFYLFFLSGDPQKWNFHEEDEIVMKEVEDKLLPSNNAEAAQTGLATMTTIKIT